MYTVYHVFSSDHILFVFFPFYNSLSMFPSPFADQHLHDPFVQLWERPPRPIHLQKPGHVCQNMDQPENADPAACPAGSEVLQPVPIWERSPLAGEKNILSVIFLIFFILLKLTKEGRFQNLLQVCARILRAMKMRKTAYVHSGSYCIA